MTAARRVLHVANGDVLAGHLRDAGLAGEVTVWADLLHEGPVGRSLSTPDWVEPRARALCSLGYAAYDQALDRFAGWQRTLDAAATDDELVFWIETDLFDQLLLVRHLAWLALERPAQRASIVYAPDFPATGTARVSPFAGADLAALVSRREPVGVGHLTRGLDTWQGFTSDTPRELAARAALPMRELPYLAASLSRWFAEWPAVDDGLSATERTALEFLVKEGEVRGRELFAAVSSRERRPFLGDLAFYQRMRDLAAGPDPLVRPTSKSLRGAGRLMFAATSLGREVFEGLRHRVRVRGIDRWFGGVHLAGHAPAFLWDRVEGRFATPGTTH